METGNGRIKLFLVLYDLSEPNFHGHNRQWKSYLRQGHALKCKTFGFYEYLDFQELASLFSY